MGRWNPGFCHDSTTPSHGIDGCKNGIFPNDDGGDDGPSAFPHLLIPERWIWMWKGMRRRKRRS